MILRFNNAKIQPADRERARLKVKIGLVLVMWTASLVSVALPQSTAAAVNFNYDTKVTYHVNTNDTTDVTEVYTVTNNTARQYLSGIKLLTPTDSILGVAVKYSDGLAIPATTAKQTRTSGGIAYNYQEISITFPRTTYGQNKTWSFNVTYQATGLVDTKGSSHTVYVPSIEEGDSGDTYSATVDAPAEFGNPHFAGAQAASGGVTDGRQFYNFAKADLVAHSLALAFGDSTIYNLNFNFPLNNDSPLPHRLTITLPPDLNNQKSAINSLDPKPTATRLDEDGNVLADYRLAPHQRLIVKTNVSGTVNYLEYDLGASGKKAEIPADLVAKYTKNTQYWQTTGAVAAEARRVTDPKAPVINNVQAIYKDVIEKLSYNDNKIQFNIRQGAAKALANPNNVVCLEYADLMIAMLRSQGIPARMPIGYAYSGNLKASRAVDDSLHAWVEAYVPGIGWMTFDPTWGEKFNDFGKSDLDHFAFAVWGEQDSLPGATMSGGADLNYQYENATLSYQSKITPIANTGKVNVRRYAILPFISIDHATYTAQAGIASDNNNLLLGRDKLNLGSLAPSQSSSINRLIVGSNWNQAAPVQLFRTSGGQTLVLASSHIITSYLTLAIVPLLLLIAGMPLAVVKLRSRTQ